MRLKGPYPQSTSLQTVENNFPSDPENLPATLIDPPEEIASKSFKLGDNTLGGLEKGE